MAWRSITIEAVRLTPAEKTAFEAIQGCDEVGAEVLLNVVREFVGTMKAAGNRVREDDTIPDAQRVHVINRARWMWLSEFPQLRSLQTQDRKDLNAAAEDHLKAIADGKIKTEAPEDDLTSPVTLPSVEKPTLNFSTRAQDGI